MKKTYLQPTTEVINIKSEQPLLSASLQIFDGTANNTDLLLAPDMPHLPGVELPGLNLPGMNLPGMGLE
jgi:hypothetical protein